MPLQKHIVKQIRELHASGNKKSSQAGSGKVLRLTGKFIKNYGKVLLGISSVLLPLDPSAATGAYVASGIIYAAGRGIEKLGGGGMRP